MKELCLLHLNWWCQNDPDVRQRCPLITFPGYIGRREVIIHVPRCRLYVSSWGRELAYEIEMATGYRIDRVYLPHHRLSRIPLIHTGSGTHYDFRRNLKPARQSILRCPVCHRWYPNGRDVVKTPHRRQRYSYGDWRGGMRSYISESAEYCKGPSELQYIQTLMKQEEIDRQWLKKGTRLLKTIRNLLKTPESHHEASESLRRELKQVKTSRI